MATKSERWAIRVTPAQDAAVRRLLAETGESLNEFVARTAVAAAENDLADRRVFFLDESQWRKLQARLDQPPQRKSKLRKLLDNPSVLEQPR
jgi:uncharacterized protein (DUF1778 family)